MKFVVLIFTTATAMILNTASAIACPGCSAAMDSTLGQGFNMSIFFLMAMPFVLFGSVAMTFVYINHKNKNSNLHQNLTEEEKH